LVVASQHPLLQSLCIMARQLDGENQEELRGEDLVFEQQMLRLNIRGEDFVYPVVTGVDGILVSRFGLNVTNEFGLWKRSDLAQIGQLVSLTLVGQGADDATLALVDCEPANKADNGAVPQAIFLQLDEAARLRCTLRVTVPTRPILLQAEIVPQGARQVTAVCSLPVFPPACKVESEDVACIMRNLPEAPGHLGIGGKVWDATFATIRWLAESSDGDGRDRLGDWVTGKNLLELGSGTGALALALGTLSPLSVTMTDLPEVVPLLEMNLALNRAVGPLQSASALRGCKFHCAPLRWGDGEDIQRFLAAGTVPDTLLLSDTVYDPRFYEPLVDTLVALCPPEYRGRQKALIIYRHRHSARSFFGLLEKYFEVELLPPLAVSGTESSEKDLSLGDLQFFSCTRRRA